MYLFLASSLARNIHQCCSLLIAERVQPWSFQQSSRHSGLRVLVYGSLSARSCSQWLLVRQCLSEGVFSPLCTNEASPLCWGFVCLQSVHTSFPDCPEQAQPRTRTQPTRSGVDCELRSAPLGLALSLVLSMKLPATLLFDSYHYSSLLLSTNISMVVDNTLSEDGLPGFLLKLSAAVGRAE